MASSPKPPDPPIAPPQNPIAPPTSPQRSFAAIVAGPQAPQNFQVSAKISSKDGHPAVIFEHQDLARAAFAFRFALVMKFSFSNRPSVEKIRIAIASRWGLKSTVKVSLLDPRHVLLQFSKEGDSIKALSRDSSRIEGVLYKIFKWFPEFNPKKDASIAPIWLQLKQLPPHLYSASFLEQIVRPIGVFLRAENATITMSNTQRARICCLVDLLKPLPQQVWVNTSRNSGYFQKVTYEMIPSYCTHCELQGHEIANCLKLNPEKKAEMVNKGKNMSKGAAQQVFDEMPESRENENLGKENDIIDLEKQGNVTIDQVLGVPDLVAPNCNAFEVLGDDVRVESVIPHGDLVCVPLDGEKCNAVEFEEGEIADPQGEEGLLKDNEDGGCSLPEHEPEKASRSSVEIVAETIQTEIIASAEGQGNYECNLVIVENALVGNEAIDLSDDTETMVHQVVVQESDIIRDDNGIDVCVDLSGYQIPEQPLGENDVIKGQEKVIEEANLLFTRLGKKKQGKGDCF